MIAAQYRRLQLPLDNIKGISFRLHGLHQHRRTAGKPRAEHIGENLIADDGGFGTPNAHFAQRSFYPSSQGLGCIGNIAQSKCFCEGRNPRCGFKFGRWLGISTWRYVLHRGKKAPEPVAMLPAQRQAQLLQAAQNAIDEKTV